MFNSSPSMREKGHLNVQFTWPGTGMVGLMAFGNSLAWSGQHTINAGAGHFKPGALQRSSLGHGVARHFGSPVGQC